MSGSEENGRNTGDPATGDNEHNGGQLNIQANNDGVTGNFPINYYDNFNATQTNNVGQPGNILGVSGLNFLPRNLNEETTDYKTLW